MCLCELTIDVTTQNEQKMSNATSGNWDDDDDTLARFVRLKNSRASVSLRLFIYSKLHFAQNWWSEMQSIRQCRIS